MLLENYKEIILEIIKSERYILVIEMTKKLEVN